MNKKYYDVISLIKDSDNLQEFIEYFDKAILGDIAGYVGLIIIFCNIGAVSKDIQIIVLAIILLFFEVSLRQVKLVESNNES